MQWIADHWVDVLAAVTSFITAASIVAKLTPNVYDDKFVNIILRILSLAPNKPKKEDCK